MEIPDKWVSYATICRLCLQRDGFMFGIFNQNNVRDKSIFKKIIDCTALKISAEDGLPNVICHRCLYKIEFCLEFRQLCFVSDATLRQVFLDNGKSSNNNNNSQDVLAQFNYPSSDVVMVVDPTVADYNSNVESDAESAASDHDLSAVQGYGMSNISMCTYCDHAFLNMADCLTHEKNEHNNETPYSCPECETKFEDRLQYSTHLKNVHQNEKPFKCPQCDRTFARRSDLRKHTIVHTGIKPFTCTICGKSFSRNTNLSKHMRIHSGQKLLLKKGKKKLQRKENGVNTLKCYYCNLTFKSKDRLLKHEKLHFDEKLEENIQPIVENHDLEPSVEVSVPKVEESEEGSKENRENNWSSSENMVISVDPFNHNDYPDTELRSNDETFDDPGDDETKSIENIEQGFKGFASPKEENIPSPEKPYKCNTCYKKFFLLEKLRYHQAMHSGTRPFSCDTCNKTFIRKRELDRHLVTHTGMKPFSCPRCNKSFGRKDKMIRHLRTHDVQKQYTCHTCGSNFNRRDSLMQHAKTHHVL